MGIPSVTTNLQDLIERLQDEGCYIMDRRMQLMDHM